MTPPAESKRRTIFMSASGSQADKASSRSYVRFTPESGQTGDIADCPLCAKKATFALQQIFLLDHLVGAGEQRRRHVDAERLGGRQIDDELELGRLHHRQIGGLGAFEDAAGVRAD